MKKKMIKLSGATACVSILEDRHGQWMQCTFSIVPDAPQPFPQQLSTMLEAEAAVFEKFGISQRLLPPTQGRWAAGDPTGFIPVVNEVGWRGGCFRHLNVCLYRGKPGRRLGWAVFHQMPGMNRRTLLA